MSPGATRTPFSTRGIVIQLHGSLACRLKGDGSGGSDLAVGKNGSDAGMAMADGPGALANADGTPGADSTGKL